NRQGEYEPDGAKAQNEADARDTSENPVTKQSQRQDRRRAPLFHAQEHGPEHNENGHAQQDHLRIPAARAALDDSGNETDQRYDRRNLSGPVESTWGRACDAFGVAQRQPHAGQANGYVDQEDAAPTERADEQPADHRAGGNGDAAARGPQTDGAGPQAMVVAARMVDQ